MTDRDRDTQDLRPEPSGSDQADKRTKRFGRRMLGAGITTCVATALAAQTAAIISQQRMFSDRAAELFAILTLVALMTLGAALIAVGGTERTLRPMRARQHANDETLDRLRILIEQGAIDQQERYENIQGLVAALPGRVSAVENGMAALADTLPEEVKRRYWVGFNDAVREGFTEATGTDGNGADRIRHMNLVQRPNEEGQP